MKIVLLDIDDTIFDFYESAKATIIKCCKDYNIEFTDKMIEHYMEQNEFLWQQYEKRIITREDIFRKRFPELFKEYGIEIDGIKFEESFQKYFKTEYKLIEGAVEIIKYLSEKYDLYIVSNSLIDTQRRRLTAAGIIQYFKDLFVSDIFGYQKPTKEFFNCCFARIPNFENQNAIIIGDSLSSDIKGGYNAGIKTCWFNPTKRHNITKIEPDYEITSLEEIKNIL